ncbi:unnamed protein product [Nezara viridula]|uniref:Uncharacterized protein n=1 Tax=Nezara viridula TaxID=85310 RepID=A0A9P0E3F2_NEZVI|nr:unnamed protein product [Nezara viridula]
MPKSSMAPPRASNSNWYFIVSVENAAKWVNGRIINSDGAVGVLKLQDNYIQEGYIHLGLTSTRGRRVYEINGVRCKEEADEKRWMGWDTEDALGGSSTHFVFPPSHLTPHLSCFQFFFLFPFPFYSSPIKYHHLDVRIVEHLKNDRMLLGTN